MLSTLLLCINKLTAETMIRAGTGQGLLFLTIADTAQVSVSYVSSLFHVSKYARGLHLKTAGRGAENSVMERRANMCMGMVLPSREASLALFLHRQPAAVCRPAAASARVRG